MTRGTFGTSVRNAWRGVVFVFRHERNFRVQLFIAALVLLAAFMLHISKAELMVVLLLIFLVLGLEIMNTAFEKFLDVVKPQLHEQVRVLKDIMAGVVLVSALGALVIGALIFLPYLGY